MPSTLRRSETCRSRLEAWPGQQGRSEGRSSFRTVAIGGCRTSRTDQSDNATDKAGSRVPGRSRGHRFPGLGFVASLACSLLAAQLVAGVLGVSGAVPRTSATNAVGASSAVAPELPDLPGPPPAVPPLKGVGPTSSSSPGAQGLFPTNPARCAPCRCNMESGFFDCDSSTNLTRIPELTLETARKVISL